jgi:hypothetical protein
MAIVKTGRAAYLAALEELTHSAREARALADLLECFASQLRSGRPDLDGPPVASCPTPYQVRRALERVDLARARAEEEWRRLPEDLRETVGSPQAILAEDDLAEGGGA